MRSALVIAVLLSSVRADACGLFFCGEETAPPRQAGTAVLFAVRDDQVTAHLQVRYDGRADGFSWVLPVPAVPTVDLSNEELFARLRFVSDPKFEVQWQPPEGCDTSAPCEPCDSMTGPGLVLDPNALPHGGSGIELLVQSSKGPFDYAIIAGDSPAALLSWLADNGYRPPSGVEPAIAHYLEQKYVFLALKLAKGRDVGDIMPIALSWAVDNPTRIPLRLTALAANADVPITAWILGESRAVPVNYLHAVLNAEAFDWAKCGMPLGPAAQCGFPGPWEARNVECSADYAKLLARAVDQSNGHAFVTEFAGSALVMKDKLFREGQWGTWSQAPLDNPVRFIRRLFVFGCPRTPLMQKIIRDHVPKPPIDTLPPDCREDADFYDLNLDKCIAYMPSTWKFDNIALSNEIMELVVKPTESAQQLFLDFPYLTRLSTIVSPSEMTKDPVFSFNPSLPDVSRTHTVEAAPLCSDGRIRGVRLTYPEGTTREVAGTIEACKGFVPAPGVAPVDPGAPAARHVQVLGESGPPSFLAAGAIPAFDAELSARRATSGSASWARVPDEELTVLPSGTFSTAPAPVALIDAVPVRETRTRGCGVGVRGSLPAAMALIMAFVGLRGLASRRRATRAETSLPR